MSRLFTRHSDSEDSNSLTNSVASNSNNVISGSPSISSLNRIGNNLLRRSISQIGALMSGDSTAITGVGDTPSSPASSAESSPAIPKKRRQGK